jgi:hypothetical protein
LGVQLLGEFEDLQPVADELLRDPERVGHPFAGQAAVDQAGEGLRLLERGQVDARHVRDQRDVERRGGLAETDRLEDEQYGDGRGDELPEQLSTEQGRRGWLREAKRRLDEQRAQQARPIAASRPQRLRQSKRRLEEELWTECQANAAYEAYRARGVMKDGRRFGRPANPFQPPATPVGKINVTDPDSRNVKTPRGWVQGYNAQAAVTQTQIVIAAEVTIDSPDFGHLGPMVAATKTELGAIGSQAPQVVVADAGYCHQAQMDSIVERGIQVLIPPDASKRRGTRPGWDGGLYAFMRRVLQTDRGAELYGKRQGMIEPVFAHTKFNRGMDRAPDPVHRTPVGERGDHAMAA